MGTDAEVYLAILVVMLVALAVVGAGWLHFGR